jgi:hypothetical protein
LTIKTVAERAIGESKDLRFSASSTVLNRRSFDYASRDEIARSSAQDDTSMEFAGLPGAIFATVSASLRWAIRAKLEPSLHNDVGTLFLKHPS